MTTSSNTTIRRIACALLAAVAIAVPATAQPLDTYRWQLAPFCNTISVSVTQTTASPTTSSAVYLLDGFDDQCGASRSSTIGSAFFNADGSIGIGLTTVLVPGGQAVHLEALIDLHSLSGTWRDDAGHSGAFVYLPVGANGTGGTLRPAPAPVLGPNAVGAAHINPGEVQVRVAGSCPSGQYLRGIGADGSVTCEILPPTASAGATCATGQYLRGIGGDGSLQCEALPPANPVVSGACPGNQVLRGVAPDGSLQCEPRLALNETTTVDDPVNQVGSYTSIAVGDDGLPIISHRDHGANALRITKCSNPACTAGVSVNADTVMGNFLGYYTSVAIGADGLPVISHHDLSAGSLRVVKCGNAYCSSGNMATVVDDPGDEVGRFSSLAIGADGLPVISYQNFTAGTLRVAKCVNAACSGGSTITTVDDPAGIVGAYSSLAIDSDGLPVISYYDAAAKGLRVTRCGNAACTASNISTTVDDPSNDVGQHTSIAIGADGLPVISHYDATAQALRVTKCNNAACTDTVSTTVDDQANDVGHYTSIAVGPDGRPVISYFDVTVGTLRVLKCGNAACTADNVAATVDGIPGMGMHTSIAIASDGLPVISYQNSSVNNLRAMKCATPACQ